MTQVRRRVALLASWAMLAVAIAIVPGHAAAQPPQPTTTIPPIIGNMANGLLRDVPTEYYAAIDEFEAKAIAEVLETHGLPAGDADAVKAWGRDAVRTQEFLNLLEIISTPAAERTPNEALVHEWFSGLYQQQQVDQAQAAVDQYLDWSGLTFDTMELDPEPLLPGGGGYCDFRPPAALDGGIGLFNGTYDPSLLPQCNGPGGLAQCSGLATGCPVPWPTVQQFQQWGRYVSQQEFLEDPVFSNIAMEVSAGVGLAATMVATGIATALARAYLAFPTSSTLSLFFQVFPYAARTSFKAAAELSAQAAKIAQEAAVTAARASAGVVRAGAAVFVIGTVITALVTIALEAWTIAEHMKIPVTLKEGLTKAQNTVPDLAAIAATSTGVGALLTTFVSTTTIDVDVDCQLPTPDNSYSYFPCANAPTPPGPAADDDRFLVTTTESGGAAGVLTPTIYTVNPIDSGEVGGVTANEAVRLSGDGWFVTTKHDGTLAANFNTPTVPGPTLQNLRLYYRDWEGASKVAERITDETGKKLFVVSSLESADLGQCATPPTAGATSTCLTDTIEYVEPDGTRATARIIGFDELQPSVDAVVPARAIAGEPITLSATATSAFGSGPFTYTWTVPGATLDGATVTTPINYAGPAVVGLAVSDSAGVTTNLTFPILVAQLTEIGVDVWPRSPAEYGSAPQVWAAIQPIRSQGTQCTWNQTTGVIGCVAPTGAVQFLIDGQPIGDPVAVADTYLPPCFSAGGCSIEIGGNRVYAPAVVLAALTSTPGTTHTITATYFGDDKFVGSTGSTTLDVVPATPEVTLTSDTSYTNGELSAPGSLSATVRAKPGSVGAPTGTVRFLAPGGTIAIGGAVPVNSDGTATASFTTLQFVNGITVSYSGDANFAAAERAYPISIVLPASATVTPEASEAAAGSNVELTVTVFDADGNPMPGERVSTDGMVGLPLGVGYVLTGPDGKAVVTVSSAVAGAVTYPIRVTGGATMTTATVTYLEPPAIVIVDPDVTAEIGQPISIPLTFTGDPEVTVSGLPDGLDWYPGTGQSGFAEVAGGTIGGIPQVEGVSTVTVEAVSPIGTVTAIITITIVGPPSIDTAALPDATVGAPYQVDIVVADGVAPYQFGATGLPAGLAIDPTTGRISGSPSAAGSSTVAITVVDALGGDVAESFALTVLAAAPTVTPAPPATPAPTPAPGPAAGGQLPATGTGPDRTVQLSLMLTLVGVALAAAAIRRRKATPS